MKTFKFLVLLCVLLSFSSTALSQNDETVQVREQLFTDKDKDFLQLWYHDQVAKMDLDEEGKLDYLALLQYYTFKMSRLTHIKYNYTEEEQQTRFDALVEKLHTEMKDFLSEKNYAIHLESFKEIEEAVYKKKNWEK